MSDTRNTTSPANYTLISAAHTETLVGTLAAAVQRALEIDAEYQAAMGVSIDRDGETVVHDVADWRGLMSEVGLDEVCADTHGIATMVGRARDLAHADAVVDVLRAAGCEVDVRSTGDADTWVYVSAAQEARQ